jgi:hypothetical protein
MATQYYSLPVPVATDYVKDGWDAIADLGNAVDSAVAIPSYNNQTGTTYTFVLADAAKVVSSNNASGVTFTIPPQSSITWTTGTTLTVANYGAGSVTIAGGAGVTVTNSGATVSQYGSASIIRTASDAWTVIPFAGGAALLSDSAISGTTGSPTTATYTDSGINYKSYKFTGSGSITFTKAGLIDILVVGGGGSGGLYAVQRGGGGGAGMYLQKNGVYMEAATASITIGAGASNASEGLSRNGNPGFPSGISIGANYIYTAIGGGYGNGDTGPGGSGGSGGGRGSNGSAAGSALLSGGNSGGGNASGSGGGGGGAGQAGQTGSTNVGGAGGNGSANILATGSSQTYAGGGGGNGSSTAGAGGSGGGGAGNAAGTANTGGGGGGGLGATNGYSGGSGIVIIRVRA